MIANDDHDQEEQRRGGGDDGDDDDENYNDASDYSSPNYPHVHAELCDHPWGKLWMVLPMPCHLLPLKLNTPLRGHRILYG